MKRIPLLLMAGPLLALVACRDKGEDTGDGSGPTLGAGGGDGAEECSGTAPVITDVACENLGLQEAEDGEMVPVLRLAISATDEDADLHAYRLQVYLDEQVDGTVDPSGSPYGPAQGTTGDECMVAEAGINLRLFIRGTTPAWDTTYEWGLVITDANGMDSEMYVLECTTPKEDGSDGTGAGGGDDTGA